MTEEFKGHHSPGPPCRHMEAMLQDEASGRSKGLRRWYTLSHVARCGRCRRFLRSLQEMISRLRSARAQEKDGEALERLAALIPKD